VTEDGGRSFRSIVSDLPSGGPDFVHVVRQDLRNPNLLFVGTDVGAYVSVDMGEHWQRFMEGLPTVPVHDLKIHPRDRELIAGTHGRSIWIVDIAPLQELTAPVVASDVHLFEPRPGLQFGGRPIGGESTGHQYFQTSSPSYGAEINFWIGASVSSPEGPPDRARAELTILDESGEPVHQGGAALRPGLNRYQWNFRGMPPPPPPKTEEQLQDSVAAVARIHELVDSMVEAGGDRAQLEQTRDQILSGGAALGAGLFGGGGGARAGAQRDPNAWVERPGESFPTAGGRAAESGAGRGDPAMRVLLQAARALAGGRAGRMGGGFGGGGQAPLVDGGNYTVVLKVGDREFRQPLTVIKGPDAW
jgi:hypothetical protein